MKSKPVKQGVEKKTIVIDAAGKTVGRVASQAAAILMGKKSPAYERNQIIPVSVTIMTLTDLMYSARSEILPIVWSSRLPVAPVITSMVRLLFHLSGP